MRSFTALLVLLCLLSEVASAAPPAAADPSIERFNQALDAATKHMDNAATLALWRDDGISLLPATPPIIGKPAIARFLAAVSAKYPGGRMEKFEMQCHDIEVSGKWASEWCSEHQVVKVPDGQPPFEGWGKMLLVLHRDAGGGWRLKEEMWNQAVASGAPAHQRKA